MDSLPAKPQDTQERLPQDDRDRRPPRPRNDLPHSDRRRPPDSYFPPSRRDDFPSRRHWERPRDLEPHYGRGPPEFDRDRRSFDRGGRPYDDYPRSRDYPPRRRNSPRRSRSPPRYYSNNRRRSRSRSPPPYKRMRLGNHTISPSPPRSPPRKQRYSRSRSREPPRRPPSRSPLRHQPPVPDKDFHNVNMKVEQEQELKQAATTIQTVAPHQENNLGSSQPASFEKDAVTIDIPGSTLTDQKRLVPKQERQDLAVPPITQQPTPFTHSELPSRKVSSPSREHFGSTRQTEVQIKSELDIKPTFPEVKREKSPSPQPRQSPSAKEFRQRSPSPPRHPRNRAIPPAPPAHPRRASRSPPRGPRNPGLHPKGHVTPTGPASSHPPGPRGQRRPFQSSSLPGSHPHHQPSTPQTQSPNIPSLPAPSEAAPPTLQEAAKVPPPVIPLKTLPPSLTPEFDTEIDRVAKHRAHLAHEYTNLARETRRALHELDMATIDLHAAEMRRKVADIQYEKAKNGVLGIDYVPTPETIPL